jgi:hypothetical protein
MAYIFPVNPADGQLYPVPAIPGSLQYQWSQSLGVWLIYSPLGVQSVSGLLPIVVSDGTNNATVSILPATLNNAGSMSAEDKEKLDNIPPDANTGTVKQINTGFGLTGGPITTTGTIDLEPATRTTEGGVIIGENIDVDAAGVISIPAARFGVTSINVGPGLVGAPSPIVNTGTISAALATRLTVGAVRVGSGLSVAADGTLSLAGSLQSVGVLAWGTIGITAGSPYTFTLREGYNISGITWLSGTQPRVVVSFQNALADNLYGVFLTARVSSFGSSSALKQVNQLINFSFKTTVDVQLNAVTFTTLDNTAQGGTITWNSWGDISEFDIMIIDTATF